MLLSNLDLLATAPGGVARLRELILTLAVQGKLVPQDPADEPASVLLQKIRAEKDRLIAEGKIKRDKPLAEIAEEEKPFELPQGWEWVRFQLTQLMPDFRPWPRIQSRGFLWTPITCASVLQTIKDINAFRLHETICRRSNRVRWRHRKVSLRKATY
jgi:hypothetical protein